MRNRLASVLALAVLLTAGPALAQPEAAPPSKPAATADKPDATVLSGVVVEGKAPMTVEAFAKAVGDFVHDQNEPGPIGQISRWRAPVCPMAAGLTPSLNAFMAQRIRQVAAKVGAPEGKCTGVNVLVVFTAKPDAVIADVRDHRPWLLGYHFVNETKAIAAFEPPMKSWYITATQVGGTVGGNVGSGVAMDIAESHLLAKLMTSSPGIQPTLRSQFGFVLVVVDSNRLVGHAIGPVADQIAMAALSKPVRRSGCRPLPSVMDVLNPDCPASASIDGLTPYDEAFLKGLYAYDSSEVMVFERTAIAKTMVAATAPAGRGASQDTRAGADAEAPALDAAEPAKSGSDPRTDEFVRRWAASIVVGAPDYSGMTPGMAGAARSEERAIIALFKTLGPLKSVRFDGVNPDYQSRYIATFEKGDVSVFVRPRDKDGKLSAMRFTLPPKVSP